MRRSYFALVSLVCALVVPQMYGDGCTTQSTMDAATRIGIEQAGIKFVQQAQNAEITAMRANTIPAYSGDNFSGIQASIQEASPNLKGTKLRSDSVWLLDASNLKPSPDGTPQDGQFFCSLRGASSEVSFVIPSLPTGKYALAVVDSVSEKNPWQIAVLMQQIAGDWRLAGFYPRATLAGGHDGLWYWRSARAFAAKRQMWNAWLYYREAVSLLRPVGFMSSTHLDKLLDEMSKATPPAIAQGLSAEHPLALKNSDGSYTFVTSLGTDRSMNTSLIDIVLHIKVDSSLEDVAQARIRNRTAAVTFVRNYPELRAAFHGIWILAETSGGSPFATEEPMNNLQ